MNDDKKQKLSIHLQDVMFRTLEELQERGLLGQMEEMDMEEDPDVGIMFALLYLYQYYAEREPSALKAPYDLTNSFLPPNEEPKGTVH